MSSTSLLSPNSSKLDTSKSRFNNYLMSLNNYFKDIMFLHESVSKSNNDTIKLANGRKITISDIHKLTSEYKKSLSHISKISQRETSSLNSKKQCPIILNDMGYNFFTKSNLNIPSYMVYSNSDSTQKKWVLYSKDLKSDLLSLNKKIIPNYSVSTHTLLVSLIHMYIRVNNLRKEITYSSNGTTKTKSIIVPDSFMLSVLSPLFKSPNNPSGYLNKDEISTSQIMTIVRSLQDKSPNSLSLISSLKNDDNLMNSLRNEQILLSCTNFYMKSIPSNSNKIKQYITLSDSDFSKKSQLPEPSNS